MADSPFIIDVTRENFQQLMEASFEVPVLVDFWADWCQPCKVLMPVLAALAEEYAGKFLLGKVNTEQEQELASHFGIRSIPTVKLFRNGQPVDEFMGALPDKAVREFLGRHLPRESDALLVTARECLAAGDVEGAQAALDSLPPDEPERPEVAGLRNRLYFEQQVAGAPPVAELEAKLAADPGDLDTLLKLALRKVTEQDYAAAMELLLQLMRADRSFGDDAGRNNLLKVFELLGDDALVGPYRRRMASLLH